MNRDVQRVMDRQGYRDLFPERHAWPRRARRADCSCRGGRWAFSRSPTTAAASARPASGNRSPDCPPTARSSTTPSASARTPTAPTIRQKIWDWYANDLYTRLSANAWIVLTHTRWHRDDLAGRLLQKMADRAADQWEILCLAGGEGQGDARMSRRQMRRDDEGPPSTNRTNSTFDTWISSHVRYSHSRLLPRPSSSRPGPLARVQIGRGPRAHPPAGRAGVRRLVPAGPGRGDACRMAAGVVRRGDLVPGRSSGRRSSRPASSASTPARAAATARAITRRSSSWAFTPDGLLYVDAIVEHIPLDADRPPRVRLLRPLPPGPGGHRGRAVPGASGPRVQAAVQRFSATVVGVDDEDRRHPQGGADSPPDAVHQRAASSASRPTRPAAGGWSINSWIFRLAEHDDGPDALEMCVRLPVDVKRLR